MTTKRYLKIFLPWQDEEEENWLEKMASKGWQLDSVFPFVYFFMPQPPELTIYRLDYKNKLDKDYQEYLSLFREAGWSLITTLTNWHYFKINPQNDRVPEIYNSNRAKAQKYRRLLVGLTPVLFLIASPLSRALDFGSLSMDMGLRILYVSVVILVIYSFLRVWIKLIQLNRNYQE